MVKCDVVVVGGGLIGLLTARELAKTGRDVVLLERGEIGQESSWAGGGILSPLYPWRQPAAVTALAAWSQADYARLAVSLYVNTGIDTQYQVSGHLILDTTEEETAAALAWAETLGQSASLVQGTELHDLEPKLAPDIHQALWFPKIAQIRNPRLIKALHADVAQQVRVVTGAPVRAIRTSADFIPRLRGVIVGDTRYEAPTAVFCGGAWTGDLVRGLADFTPDIAPVKGQMLLFQAPPGELRRITLSRDRYLIPRADGRTLVGSTLEHKGFDKSIDGAAQTELVDFARRLCPALATAPIERHWAGLRPGSPQGIPFIGPHPEVEGLFLNAGHFRNGVVTAPAACRLVRNLLCGETPILDPQPYALLAHRSGRVTPESADDLERGGMDENDDDLE